MNKPLGFLKDPNGDNSSKRLFGVICLVQAIVMSYVHPDPTVIGVWLGSAASVFIAQAVTKT